MYLQMPEKINADKDVSVTVKFKNITPATLSNAKLTLEGIGSVAKVDIK